MPDDIDQPVQDQLLSVSSSITLPYDELKELKAAAAAASETGLSVNVNSGGTFFVYLFKTASRLQPCLLSPKTKRMGERSNMRVNGLQETSSCGADRSITCCPATVEVERVKKKHICPKTQQEEKIFIG